VLGISKQKSEENIMKKRFVGHMLKIATFATIFTFVGLLFLNAGWISPRPIPMGQRTHVYTDDHVYGAVNVDLDGSPGAHEDAEVYIWTHN
jgi:hypothetical protein